MCFIVTIIFDNFIYTNNSSSNFANSYLEKINKSQTSLCPTNNVFLFGQEEIIPVSTTPVNTATSYKSFIFFLIAAIFSSIYINGHRILRSDKNRNGGGVACYVRADICLNSRNIF